MQRTLGVLVGVLALAGCGTADPAPCQIQSAANGGYYVRLLRTAAATAGCDTDTPAQIGDQWIFDVYETDPTNITNFSVIGYSTILGQPPDPPNSGSSPLYTRSSFTSRNPAADNTCVLGDATMTGTAADPNGVEGKYQIGNWVWLRLGLLPRHRVQGRRDLDDRSLLGAIRRSGHRSAGPVRERRRLQSVRSAVLVGHQPGLRPELHPRPRPGRRSSPATTRSVSASSRRSSPSTGGYQAGGG